MVEDFNSSFGLGLLADFFPVFKYIPTPGERKVRKMNDFLKGYFKDALKEHRKNLNPGEICYHYNKFDVFEKVLLLGWKLKL